MPLIKQAVTRTLCTNPHKPATAVLLMHSNTPHNSTTDKLLLAITHCTLAKYSSRADQTMPTLLACSIDVNLVSFICRITEFYQCSIAAMHWQESKTKLVSLRSPPPILHFKDTEAVMIGFMEITAAFIGMQAYTSWLQFSDWF